MFPAPKRISQSVEAMILSEQVFRTIKQTIEACNSRTLHPDSSRLCLSFFHLRLQLSPLLFQTLQVRFRNLSILLRLSTFLQLSVGCATLSRLPQVSPSLSKSHSNHFRIREQLQLWTRN